MSWPLPSPPPSRSTGLLDSDLAALTKIPACRAFLAFDNKRVWFRAQLRTLKQEVRARIPRRGSCVEPTH